MPMTAFHTLPGEESGLKQHSRVSRAEKSCTPKQNAVDGCLFGGKTHCEESNDVKVLHLQKDTICFLYSQCTWMLLMHYSELF